MICAATFEDTAILELTPNGRRQLLEPGTQLLPLQLEALVLIDGHITVSQVQEHLRAVTHDSLHPVLYDLLEAGFIRLLSNVHDAGFDPGSFFDRLTVSDASPAFDERYQKAAMAGSKFLQSNGYCVNMARTVRSGPKRNQTRSFTVLAIDDDPDICNLLKLYLKLERMEVHTASNRAEIIEQLRNGVLPDLVLLDVVLPDVNGFDLLGRLRSHHAFQQLPIIMLTAESSRGGVLRGIAGGADGYVTKPFQMQPLVHAIKTVLGLEYLPQDLIWDTL
jgi:two-component system OmpR family response regulator